MLEEEFQEDFLRKKLANKNLRNAFIALGLLILSGVAFLIGSDSFYLDDSDVLIHALIISFYGLALLSFILTVMTLINSLNAVRKMKDSKNYVAIAITVLILIALGNEILQRL